jgi:hypothetical protein
MEQRKVIILGVGAVGAFLILRARSAKAAGRTTPLTRALSGVLPSRSTVPANYANLMRPTTSSLAARQTTAPIGRLPPSSPLARIISAVTGRPTTASARTPPFVSPPRQSGQGTSAGGGPSAGGGTPRQPPLGGNLPAGLRQAPVTDAQILGRQPTLGDYQPGGALFVGPIDPAAYEPGGALFVGPIDPNQYWAGPIQPAEEIMPAAVADWWDFVPGAPDPYAPGGPLFVGPMQPADQMPAPVTDWWNSLPGATDPYAPGGDQFVGPMQPDPYAPGGDLFVGPMLPATLPDDTFVQDPYNDFGMDASQWPGGDAGGGTGGGGDPVYVDWSNE